MRECMREIERENQKLLREVASHRFGRVRQPFRCLSLCARFRFGPALGLLVLALPLLLVTGLQIRQRGGPLDEARRGGRGEGHLCQTRA